MSCPCCRAAILSAGPNACVECPTLSRQSLLDGTFSAASGEFQRSGPAPRNGIHSAAAAGDIQRVRELLSSATKGIKWLDDFGVSPFHTAAQGDHADVVRLLLAQGVHPDINGYGATALHRACSWGSIRVVRALIDSGRADVNIVDTSFGDKQTPLMKAASADKAGIVALLLAAGADPLRTSARGLTAHEIAVKMGSQQSLRRLLKDHEDWVEPSLVQATVAGHVAIVNELANRLGLPASRREALIGDAKQSGKALRLKEAKSTEMAMLADSKSYVKRILLSPPRSTTCLQETGKQEPADAAQSDCAGKPARKNRLIKLTGNLSRYRRISGTSCVLKKA